MKWKKWMSGGVDILWLIILHCFASKTKVRVETCEISKSLILLRVNNILFGILKGPREK